MENKRIFIIKIAILAVIALGWGFLLYSTIGYLVIWLNQPVVTIDGNRVFSYGYMLWTLVFFLGFVIFTVGGLIFYFKALHKKKVKKAEMEVKGDDENV